MIEKKLSRRESAFRCFGKRPRAGKVLSDASGNVPAPGKCFPMFRETSLRRESAFRCFGKRPRAGKVLSDVSGNVPAVVWIQFV